MRQSGNGKLGQSKKWAGQKGFEGYSSEPKLDKTRRHGAEQTAAEQSSKEDVR